MHNVWTWNSSHKHYIPMANAEQRTSERESSNHNRFAKVLLFTVVCWHLIIVDFLRWACLPHRFEVCSFTDCFTYKSVCALCGRCCLGMQFFFLLFPLSTCLFSTFECTHKMCKHLIRLLSSRRKHYCRFVITAVLLILFPLSQLLRFFCLACLS